MRILLGRSTVVVPDYAPHPGRILIETEAAAIVSRPRPASRRQILQLARERIGLAVTTLKLDGPLILLAKARHMWLRERFGPQKQYICFSGTIAGSDLSRRFEPRAAVAGFSLTHLQASERTLTRPEQVWQRPDGVSAEIGALALHGGLLLSALERAGASTVGVLGSTLLSELAMVLAKANSIAVLRAHDGRAWQYVRNHSHPLPPQSGGPDDAAVWLAPNLPSVPDRRSFELVLGCVGTLPELRAAFPRARKVAAMSAEEIVETRDRNVDLFYDCGPIEYPEWFRPESCEKFLQHAARLDLSVEAPAQFVPRDTHAAEPAPGAGLRFVRFQPEERAPRARAAHRAPAAVRNGMINVGLIGAGRWSLGMVARQMAASERVRLKSVCDRRPEACYLAQQALPFEKASTDARAVIEDSSLDVVVVATYHGAHAELAAAVLKAGKHCFLEKPAAVTHDQFWTLAEAARAADGILHVGFNRRFSPLVTGLREALRELSGPTRVQSYMRVVEVPANSWYHWPSEGSRVIGNACHIMDLALGLTEDSDPLEIEAHRTGTGRPDEDVSISVTYADGSLATLVYTKGGHDRVRERHVAVRGDRTGEIEDFKRLRTFGRHGKSVQTTAQDFGHRRQVQLFLDAVGGSRAAPIDLRTLLISSYSPIAADQSLRTGRPVSLPIKDIDRVLGRAS
jgi:predicted dehydrogenase